MKPPLLARLQRNGACYIAGALLLLIGIPLYQFLVLLPQGYAGALSAAGNGSLVPYIVWIGGHIAQFVGYRILLMLAFAAMLSLPFTLFRIIVAQELLADTGKEEEVQEHQETQAEEIQETQEAENLPAEAWRGKGFVVLGAWSGVPGILLYILGTLASTLYLALTSSAFSARSALPGGFSTISSILAFIPNTIGIGLLALACLFFGIAIARRGLNLWPGIWVAFGYIALVAGILLSASAIAVASAPTGGQGTLATLAILLFGLWVLWLGVMLVRLKPEA